MKYTIEPHGLVFTIDEDERAVLQHIHDDDPEHFDCDQVMYDWFEGLVCNSEFMWCSASDTYDLTDAPMLCILGREQVVPCTKEKEPGYIVSWRDNSRNLTGRCPIIQRWAFMAYETTTPHRCLLEDGRCFWQGGDFMDEPEQTEITVAARVARAKREVIGDVLDGTVPHDVKSFSQLHDYVDANYYGGAFEEEFEETDKFCAFWNQVQNAVHEWIASGQMFQEATEEASRRGEALVCSLASIAELKEMVADQPIEVTA